MLNRHGWSGDAELDVTLLNAEDGYKYEEYGDCVTVRRTIKRPNGGGYSLIGADGSVRAHRVCAFGLSSVLPVT